jgi:hypothetical protein
MEGRLKNNARPDLGSARYPRKRRLFANRDSATHNSSTLVLFRPDQTPGHQAVAAFRKWHSLVSFPFLAPRFQRSKSTFSIVRKSIA